MRIILYLNLRIFYANILWVLSLKLNNNVRLYRCTDDYFCCVFGCHLVMWYYYLREITIRHSVVIRFSTVNTVPQQHCSVWVLNEAVLENK